VSWSFEDETTLKLIWERLRQKSQSGTKAIHGFYSRDSNGATCWDVKLLITRFYCHDHWTIRANKVFLEAAGALSFSVITHSFNGRLNAPVKLGLKRFKTNDPGLHISMTSPR